MKKKLKKLLIKPVVSDFTRLRKDSMSLLVGGYEGGTGGSSCGVSGSSCGCDGTCRCNCYY